MFPPVELFHKITANMRLREIKYSTDLCKSGKSILELLYAFAKIFALYPFQEYNYNGMV